MEASVAKRWGYYYMKFCSDVHTIMRTPHIKMCSDVPTRVGTPHIKYVQMFKIGRGHHT